MRFSLFPKLLISFLVLSLPPLVWLGVDAAGRIRAVGERAVEQSTRVLDSKGEQALELQAGQLAEEISRFLEERVQDLRFLAEIPKDPDSFLAFSRARRSELWKRERGEAGRLAEAREAAPLYSEVAWVDARGLELFRADGDHLAPRERLRRVADPRGTTFGVEDYFREVRRLPRGEPYVGHLVGRHVSKAEQLAGAATEEDATAGVQYRGHIRFALGKWTRGRFEGAVVLALDHRHLMEFTQHVLPLSREKVAFPSYFSGNYAFLFDDRGWIITHPKLWDLPGLDEQGKWVPAYTAHSSKEDVEAGRIPFRLDEAGFVHPNYPLVAQAVRAGRSGVARTYNVSRVDKVMAYAPIRFRHESYGRAGVFGGVTVGARTDAFHQEAAASGREIAGASRQTLRTGFLLAWVLALIVVAASLGLSRAIAHPIHTLAWMARRIAGGHLSARVAVRPGDEVGDLAVDFNRMAGLLEEKDQRLRGSLEDLSRSRDDAEAYAARLKEQLRILSNIQSISEFLGTTFDREEALQIILRTCVEGLGFDRAALYVVDSEGEYLRCVAWAGFSPQEEAEVLGRKLLLKDDSAPVRAVRERRSVQGTDDLAEWADGAGVAPRRQARAFAYLPMTIRDSVVGALGADLRSPGGEMPDHLVGALQIVAGQAARAIERARLFEAANRERAFVEAVVASIASGLITLDSAGRILTTNPYARRTLGIDGSEARGKRLADCGVDPALSDWVESVRHETELVPVELELATPEGRPVFTCVPSRFATEKGEGLILQFRDVTHERAMNRALERVDRLASLGRLAAGVAHEVRNPLTGISLLLDDLHDRLSGDGDRTLVARALQEIERLDGIVQGLLDYARVGSVDRRPLSLREVVEGSLFLVKKTGRSQGVDLRVELDGAMPTVLGDPEKLKQALLNFYLNALHAMPGGGKLTVAAGAAEGGALLRIADTGDGIPEGEREKIFEPFYTLRPGGSGLGLSIAHTIITDHGGRIEVSSQLGKGTEFRIYLPGSLEG